LGVSILIAGKKPVTPEQVSQTQNRSAGATPPAITKWQQSLARLHKQMIGKNAAKNITAIRASIAQDHAQRQTLIDLRDRIDEILTD